MPKSALPKRIYHFTQGVPVSILCLLGIGNRNHYHLDDHVSPISDTTALTSVGTEYDHLAHVTSQAANKAVTGLVALWAFGLAGA